ncbi:MAG TPA: hypothetical protein VJ732_03650 [Bryobacteraceae bacterium]|nr:hypothetical protein [Bryobacteraceae bacterium]
MPETLDFVHGLYAEFFERGVRYFFPNATLRATASTSAITPSLTFLNRTDGTLDLEWMGIRYHLERPGRPFTENQVRLLGAIGGVLSARYRSIFFAPSAASGANLFAGLPEDRYVSAFLEHLPYLDETGLPTERDIVGDAIEVLRESSLLTYENRRISTGVLLTTAAAETRAPAFPQEALPYNNLLVAIKSFHRLCDGLHTVFLVDREGKLGDLVDIEQFSRPEQGKLLPAPSSARYRPHSLATLHGGNICLVLTPNGEIKIFAAGAQVFHFLEGRWHLTDVAEKYHEFHQALGNAALAERLFTVALNLAEARRGGLFVLLGDRRAAASLVAPGDLLAHPAPGGPEAESAKAQLHYLLRGKSARELDLRVLESVARVDGGIVMDREGALLAFGAILRSGGEPLAAQEGGRTTAAVHASRFGLALKISEDGLVSFYRSGERLWEI